jgi:hypothetical protein
MIFCSTGNVPAKYPSFPPFLSSAHCFYLIGSQVDFKLIERIKCTPRCYAEKIANTKIEAQAEREEGNTSSAYEQARDENVKRNNLLLQSLGFAPIPLKSGAPEEYLNGDKDKDEDTNFDMLLEEYDDL